MTEQVVWLPGGVRTEIHLGSADTDGAFSLKLDQAPVGSSLPPHRHQRAARRSSYSSGVFEMEIAGQSSRLGPGQSIHIPGGVVHSGGNVGQASGRRIVISSPAGMERFFSEVGTATPEEEVDAAAALQSARRHGTTPR